MTYPPRLSAHQCVRLAIVVGVIAPLGSHMQSEQEGRVLTLLSGLMMLSLGVVFFAGTGMAEPWCGWAKPPKDAAGSAVAPDCS